MYRLIIPLLAVVIFIGCSSPELTYKGKSLSEWALQLGDKDETKVIEAVHALGEIGPDAYPAKRLLVAMMSHYTSRPIINEPSSNILVAIPEALQKIDKPRKDGKISGDNNLEEDPLLINTK